MKTTPRNPFLSAMKSNPLHRFRSASAGALTTFILLPMALPVSAANLYWEGIQTAQGSWEIWQTVANWDTLADGTGGAPGVAPTSTDIAIFNTTANNGTRGARLSATRSIGGLIFNNTGTTGIASETSTVRTLTIGSSGITMASNAGSVTLATGSRPMNVTLGASQIWQNNNSASTLSHIAAGSTLALGANTLTVDGVGATTISSGTLTGTTASVIAKNGAGVLTLSSATTTAGFLGDLQIGAGTVRYGVANGVLPSTTDVIFNTTSGTATLDLNGFSGTIASLKIDGATGTNAAITTGAGTLTLGGGILYNDGITGTSNGATISGNLDLGAASRDFNIRDSGVAVELLVDAVISGTGVGLTKINNGALTLSGLNTFSGAVILREGVTSVNTLANVNAASSLGTGAVTSVVQLGYGNRTGHLQYTGATTSTDRQIQLGRSTAAEVGGGVIENNGSGALTFSNTVAGFNAALAGVTATRNLSLRGTNTDLNTISGIIRDNDTGTNGLVQLTKEDAGTWVLGGANTYTGATTINGGMLVVTDTIGSSAVTINNSGTILASDTAATIGSTLTVNNGAILAVGGAANASTATATVVGASTFNNGSIFAWDINSAGTSSDKLITSSLAGGSANFVIVAADSTFADPFWDTNQTWTDIFTTDGSTAISNWASLFSMSVVNSSFTGITPVGGSFSISGNTLAWTAVPEPTSALAGLLITAGLLRRRRTV